MRKFSRKTRGRFRSLVHIVRAGGFYWLKSEISQRPVIVLGAPNSGTTMLVRALDQHPELVNRSEERVLWNPRFHEQELTSDYRSAEYASAWKKFVIQGNFAYFHRILGHKKIVNKHPENSLRVEFLQAIFPEACYIHLLRDGRAVVNSNLKRSNSGVPFAGWVMPPDWEKHVHKEPVEQFAYMWKCCVDSIQTAAPKLKNFKEIRYEDLAAGQDEVFRDLFQWLQITADEYAIRQMPRVENRNFKWERNLTVSDLERIEECAGDTLKRNLYTS